MSIKLRLTLLVGLLLMAFVATYLVLHAFRQNELERMTGEERRARIQLLDHWIELATRALPQFAADAAESPELAADLAASDPEGGRRRIEENLARAGVDALWIVGPDGTVRRHVAAPGRPAIPEFPVPAAEFARLARETPNARFFAAPRSEVLELAIRRLSAPSGPGDWLVAGRHWDAAHLRALAELTESSVSVISPEELTQPPGNGSRLLLLRPLIDWRGQPLRTLRIEYDLSALENLVHTEWRPTQLFLGFGLLVIAAVAVALQGWVLRPLALIGESLARNDSAPVQTLSRQKTELGRLAQLVLTSFAQREALQSEVRQRTLTQQALERSEAELRHSLEERARLGRDLHDGVIQSLYAAGMGLAGIRMQLQPEQTEAAARLEQTRAALNETIHDVRNFIIGLEPEALKLQTFAQAVAALIETLHSLRTFQSTVEIDERIAARLTLAQRVHALQITREAISNALRHGSANAIKVTLGIVGGFAEFEIRDDGSGFDPNEVASSGHGLRNLAQRARELNAELSVDSKPGAGTRVKLVFSLNQYD